MVVLCHLRAAEDGKIPWQAVKQGGLHKYGGAQLATASVAIAPCADAIFFVPLTHHKRRSGIGLDKLTLRAVALIDGNFQIAALCGRIEIPDHERTGGDLGFIDDITMLAYRYSGVAVGDAMDNRREAALAVRQHFVIRHKLRPAELHAVKHFASGIGIAHAKLAFQALNITFEKNSLRLPVTRQVVTVA